MPQDRLETVFSFVHDYMATHGGVSPSQREIARGCFINVAYVARYLDLLEAQGRLIRERGQARSIQLRPPP